jgi:hypothetical protein
MSISIFTEGADRMYKQISGLAEALAEAEQLNQRKKVETAVLSVYMPQSLISAFKEVCRARREKHSVVIRKFIIQYLQENLD